MMRHIVEQLRTGDWINHERIWFCSLGLLVASCGGLLFLFATAHGLNDYQGRPLGTDFAKVYSAGTFVLDGEPGLAHSPPAQHAREQEIFGKDTPFYGWLYPPVFLFVAAALASLPYLPALAAYQGATLVLYLLMLHAIVSSSAHFTGQGQSGKRTARRGSGRLWLLTAIASPAVFVNIGHGHNGFLTAALMGTGLLLLDRRPIVAGVLFGLLAYKPHFGIMIALVLIATGRWRILAAAAATVLALAAVTTLAFGSDIWRSFIKALPFIQGAVLEDGGTGWHKIQGVFSWVRMWGGNVSLAYAMQGAAVTTLAAALIWLWRSDASERLKAAALPIATLLAAPYSLDYDFVVLAPAIALLVAEGLERGFRAWEKTALALLWFMPLIARTLAEQALIPLGVPAMGFVLLLMLRRAAQDTGSFQHWQSAAHPIK